MGLERYGSDYSPPEETFSEDLSPPEEELSSGSRLSRLGDRLTGLREGLVTSERQEAAKAFAISVGREAAIGAIQGSRLLEVDRETDDVRIRPVRLAMGALRPGRTLRRAATGAAKGARRGAISGSVQGGVELVRGFSSDQGAELVDPTAGEDFGQELSPESGSSLDRYR